MEISALTIKLIILLIPGALAAIIYRRLTISHKPRTDLMFVTSAVIQGFFCYVVLQIIRYGINFCNTCGLDTHIQPVLSAFHGINKEGVIPYWEVLEACFIGVLMGFATSGFEHHGVLFRFAKFMELSTKYGEENLFTRYLNSPDVWWIYVRDVKRGLVYKGQIKYFSETPSFREIVLLDVTVFNYPDSQELYSIPSIYLSLQPDNIIIEQAQIQNG